MTQIKPKNPSFALLLALPLFNPDNILESRRYICNNLLKIVKLCLTPYSKHCSMIVAYPKQHLNKSIMFFPDTAACMPTLLLPHPLCSGLHGTLLPSEPQLLYI